MANEPQRDLEHDLRAYKQRRDRQLGAPIELHPATRRMLQAEAARAAARPLLTSEEAAKNFVRSFVMSHQPPSFFARYRLQLIGGGALCACLALVLAVLRHDPQQAAREITFDDNLPAPIAAPEPGAAKSTTALARKVVAENETLKRQERAPESQRGLGELAKAPTPPASPAPLPTPAPTPAPVVAARPAAAPVLRESLKAEVELKSDSNRRAGEVSDRPLARNLAATRSAVSSAKDARGKNLTVSDSDLDLMKRKSESDAKANFAGSGGAGGGGLPQLVAPTGNVVSGAKPVDFGASSSSNQASALGDQTKKSGSLEWNFSNVASSPVGTALGVQQRFQQMDPRAGYRQNFNSPPLPAVMRDFAFERSGDRVRIVDADGSTYEGSVLDAPGANERLKELKENESAARTDSRKKMNNEAAAQNDFSTFQFVVTGTNRKLNQTVEFRGEWQPPGVGQGVAQAAKAPAFQATSLAGQRQNEVMNLQLVKGQVTNDAASQLAFDRMQPTAAQANDPASGRISGRAVIGGKNSFEINAVPK